jgi:hypothetical protein
VADDETLELTPTLLTHGILALTSTFGMIAKYVLRALKFTWKVVSHFHRSDEKANIIR